MDKKQYPKGHFLNIGIALGLPIGVAIGVALDNIGAGIGIGIALGAGIGAVSEKKHNPNPRELTEKEEKAQKKSLVIALSFGIIGLICAIAVYLFLK